MESEELKCWLESAIDYLFKYAKEHNEDVIPETVTIKMIIDQISE
jgi:hypothetical protein